MIKIEKYKNLRCPGFFAEFLGTAILVMVGVGTAVLAGSHVGYIGIALAFGLTLMVLTYVFSPVSGCHVNPAVTLAMLLTKQIKGGLALGYVISQLLGGILGAYIIYLIAMGKPDFSIAVTGFSSNGFGLHSPEGYALGAVMLVEIALTTVLLLTILAVKHYRSHEQAHGAMIIGGVFAAIFLVALPVSGASFNFARSLGTAFFERGWALDQLWVFALAQIIAAVIAVMIYRLMMVIYADSFQCVTNKNE